MNEEDFKQLVMQELGKPHEIMEEEPGYETYRWFNGRFYLFARDHGWTLSDQEAEDIAYVIAFCLNSGDVSYHELLHYLTYFKSLMVAKKAFVPLDM